MHFWNYSLLKMTEMDVSLVTTADYAYERCFNLHESINYNMPNCLNARTMHGYNYRLSKTPKHNLPLCQTHSLLFIDNKRFKIISEMDVSNSNNFADCFLGVTAIVKCGWYGGRYSISYINNNLSRNAIVEIFNNLGTAINTSQSINVAGNPGASQLLAEDISIATNKGYIVTLS